MWEIFRNKTFAIANKRPVSSTSAQNNGRKPVQIESDVIPKMTILTDLDPLNTSTDKKKTYS